MSKKRKVRSATFKMGRYVIEELDGPIEGMCEVPGGPLYMMIPKPTSAKKLAVILHEAGHAEGIPDKYLDGDRDCMEPIARLVWRLLEEQK